MRVWIVLLIFSAVILALCYNAFNPGAIDGKDFFDNIASRGVYRIELDPLDGDSPIGRSISIDDGNDISYVLGIWKGMGTFIPNHPENVWEISVKFYAKKGVYSGVLRRTANLGVTFDFDKGPTAWPVSARYQLIKSYGRVEEVLNMMNKRSR
jgi:hypothetical protein